jgi:DNA-binding NarL/FixJ family response regulator
MGEAESHRKDTGCHPRHTDSNPAPHIDNAVMAEPIRLFLVDDESIVRTGLRLRLGVEPDFEIVGEAGDGNLAIEGVTEARPDVVLMDVHLPVLDGIAATRAIRASLPQCAVVMLSLQDDAQTRERAREAGAYRFVAKHDIDATLTAAIREAAADRRIAEGGGAD